MNSRRFEVSGPGMTFAAIALMLLFASTGWATTSPCTPTASLASFGATDPANGCYEVDQSFSNFSVADSSTIGTTQTTSTDLITGSNNYSGSPATPFLVYGTFTPATAADWQATGTGHVQGTINYLVDSQQNYITDPIYPAGALFQIDSVSMAVEGTAGTGDSITITKTICLPAECGTPADVATLTITISGGNPSSVLYGCNAATLGTCSPDDTTVDFSTAISVATLNISDQYNLTVNGSGTDTLSSFVNFFGEEETPEPSSFVLLGTALAGLAFLRLRRKASE